MAKHQTIFARLDPRPGRGKESTQFRVCHGPRVTRGFHRLAVVFSGGPSI
ncbi:hypothetical protein [Paracoccus sp. IB05]|nr:hypothetical protein [Paracoccus sp. IB05]MBJ2150288.1 hypothetical protein [Paracoccus sp. IB05]